MRLGELILGHGGNQGEYGGDSVSIDSIANVSEESANGLPTVRMRRRTERESEEVIDDEIWIGRAVGDQVIDESFRRKGFGRRALLRCVEAW